MFGSPWLQSTAFYFGGAAITYFDLVRTGLILLLTYACARLSSESWKRLKKRQPDIQSTHFYSINRIITGLIIVIGISVALAFLGIDFRNLTLIASALSVGIGFGLKNLIENASAGTMLLSERTIRVGDWIVVGDIEGFVKTINSRSTVIESWDKADVVIPNSHLISNMVTNWTLTARTGRIIVPLSVAYASTPAQVEKLLLEVAESNPEVVKDGPVPDPLVLFRGYGDSALEFELRCFITDITRRLIVISDINHAISVALEEQGIEVPYPQRDVHLKAESDGLAGKVT